MASHYLAGKKLNFDDALQRINDDRSVERDHVLASALRRKLWIAEWHIPGCVSESQSYCLTKAEAIEAACLMAEGENGAPRGMKTALRKGWLFVSKSPMFGQCVNTIDRVTLADIL